nr:photosystem II reaction center protein Ycf12 [Halomicronema hongdechloris]
MLKLRGLLPGRIAQDVKLIPQFRRLGGSIEFMSGTTFELIAQLTMLTMIVIAGPVIVFLLAAQGGDL